MNRAKLSSQEQAQLVAQRDNQELKGNVSQITDDLQALEEIQTDLNGILFQQTDNIESIDDALDSSDAKLRAGLKEVVKYEKGKKKNMGLKGFVGGGTTGAAIGVGIAVAAGPVGAAIAIGAGVGAVLGGVVGGKVGSSLKKRAHNAIDKEHNAYKDRRQASDKALGKTSKSLADFGIESKEYDPDSGDPDDDELDRRFRSQRPDGREGREGREDRRGRGRFETQSEPNVRPTVRGGRLSGGDAGGRGHRSGSGGTASCSGRGGSGGGGRSGSVSSGNFAATGQARANRSSSSSSSRRDVRAQLFEGYKPSDGDDERDGDASVWTPALRQAYKTQKAVSKGSNIIDYQGETIRPMKGKISQQLDTVNTAERVQNASSVWGSIRNWWAGDPAPALPKPTTGQSIREQKRQGSLEEKKEKKEEEDKSELGELANIIKGLKDDVTLHSAHLNEHNNILDQVDRGTDQVGEKLKKQERRMRRK